MDAVEFFKTANRLCKNQDCKECPVAKEGRCMAGFNDYLIKNIEETVSKVEQWAKDHPAKTRKSEFLKMFPNADIGNVLPCDLDRTLLRPHCNDDDGCVICMREYWGKEVSDND